MTSRAWKSSWGRSQPHHHLHWTGTSLMFMNTSFTHRTGCRIWSHSDSRSWWCDQVRLTVGFKSGLRLIIVIIDRSFCNFYSCISSVRVLPWSQSDLQPLSRSTEAGLSGGNGGEAASLTSESLTCFSSSGSLKDVRTFRTNPTFVFWPRPASDPPDWGAGTRQYYTID